MSDIDLEEWLSQTEYRAYRVVDHVGASSNKERVFMDGLENLAKVRKEASRLRKRIDELETENERLREGLGFYADEEHLETGDRGGSVPKDFGCKAKQILKEVSDD